MLAALATVGTLLTVHWPFTSARMMRSLSGVTGSRVQFKGPVRLLFYPHPGFEARDVEVRRGSDTGFALATLHRLRIVGSWTALLTMQHRLMQVEAGGLV